MTTNTSKDARSTSLKHPEKTTAVLAPDITEATLAASAVRAMQHSWSPYSRFRVGAALLTTDGTVYTGCNIENASFGATNCAERTAIFKAVSEGYTSFVKIAIVGGNVDRPVENFCYPCGVCRQVMMEFCDPDSFEIISATDEDHYRKFTLRELLPEGFGPDVL